MPKLALAFDVLANDKGATRTLDKVAHKSEQTSKRIGSSFGKLAGAITGAFAGIAIVDVLRSSINEASDLNETISKTNNVFKSNARQVIAWSKGSAKSFGLSQQAALAAASQYGDMFHQLGFTEKQSAVTSEKLVKLAADLGSFHNVDPSDVLERIGGALRGEYDSLQQLIPNISAARVEQEALAETHKKSAKELTAAEKATATLAIIQRDGANAANDFAETSDGLANKQRILSAQFKDTKAKLGQELLPVMSSFVGFLSSDVLPTVDKFVTGFQDGTGAGGAFKDAMADVGDGLDTAWKVGKPFLKFIGDHPKLFTEIAVGAGAFATAMKVIGTVKKLPGLGSLVSKAAPLPVFVVNNGVGLPGGKTPPPVAPTGSKVGTALKGVGLSLPVVGSVLLTSGDSTGPAKFPETKQALADLANSIKLNDEARALYLKAIGAKKNASREQNAKAPLDKTAAINFVLRYGGGTQQARALLKQLGFTVPPVGPFAPVVDNHGLLHGIAEGAKSLQAFGAIKPTPKADLDTHGLFGGIREAAQHLQELDRKRPKPQVLTTGITPAKDRVDALAASIAGLKSKTVDIRAQVTTSGKSIKLGAIQSDGRVLYIKAEGGKQLLAGGGWVVGPGTGTSDSVPLMGSRGEFMLREKVASKYARQVEALNAGVPLEKVAASGGGGLSMTNYITVADNRTALSAPDQIAAKMFAKGFYR